MVLVSRDLESSLLSSRHAIARTSFRSPGAAAVLGGSLPASLPSSQSPSRGSSFIFPEHTGLSPEAPSLSVCSKDWSIESGARWPASCLLRGPRATPGLPTAPRPPAPGWQLSAPDSALSLLTAERQCDLPHVF